MTYGSKNTPGPWAAELEVDPDGFETGKYWLIMGAQPCAYAFDRIEDAFLAAAAPDLLEALEAMLGREMIYNREEWPQVGLAKAAIKKAKGL